MHTNNAGHRQSLKRNALRFNSYTLKNCIENDSTHQSAQAQAHGNQPTFPKLGQEREREEQHTQRGVLKGEENCNRLIAQGLNSTE